MEKRQVKIGPEFFAKAKQDYADWKLAIVREFMQNSMDARGSKKIKFSISAAGSDTLLEVENDGDPMSEDVLLNKLLVLGGSGKNFADGSVGGFGKAKEILYFSHRSYKIRTGTLEVQGIGADYSIQRGLPNFHGTKSEVMIHSDITSDLYERLTELANYAQWDGELVVNYGKATPKVLLTDTHKGRPVREFSWGKVYVSKAGAETLVVRVGGIPMFTRHVNGVNRLVIVELVGASNSVLQSSRDALKTKEGHQLDNLLAELAVDKRSALKDRSQTTVKIWQGTSFETSADKDAYVKLREASLKVGIRQVAEVSKAGYMSGGDVDYADSPLGFQFIVKAEDGKKPRKGYANPAEFNANAKGLVTAWSKILLKFWELFGEKTQFNIGFVFTDSAVAQYDTNYGHGFLINPLLAGGKDGDKWILSPERRWELVAVAAHEFVHYKGYGYHDENYTSYYTLIVEPVLLRHRAEFEAIFQQARVEMKGPQDEQD